MYFSRKRSPPKYVILFLSSFVSIRSIFPCSCFYHELRATLCICPVRATMAPERIEPAIAPSAIHSRAHRCSKGLEQSYQESKTIALSLRNFKERNFEDVNPVKSLPKNYKVYRPFVINLFKFLFQYCTNTRWSTRSIQSQRIETTGRE